MTALNWNNLNKLAVIKIRRSMSKVIGFDAALKLLREGHTMVHELPSMRTSIDGLTVVHPGFHYLVPYCDRKKQTNGDVFYTLKEKNA